MLPAELAETLPWMKAKSGARQLFCRFSHVENKIKMKKKKQRKKCFL
jgi:hypothetical protein